MNISYKWLKDYIDIDLTPDELAGILTGIGLEVASVREVESIKGGLKGLVIGKVMSCEKHPSSDHLSITSVDIGNGQALPIVCGAPNVASGQKVVVATTGTVLYDGDKEITIKKSKIRGEVSEGMICAEDEIGLGNSHEGIIVLPDEASEGTPASEWFNVESDYVIEVDLTPNRIDSASHIGMARDVAACLNAAGAKDKVLWRKPSVDDFKAYDNTLQIPVEIANPDACHRYAALTIRDVKIGESPEWLKNRLRTVGLNPINNVVDITNYVLLETGQPLHAFDAEEIKGNKVIVKTLPAGTIFTTLDGVERTLHQDDLMICNTEEAMCIGGVFGGIKSGVKESTRNIFLESAYFDPVFIRKTARRHGLPTDASFRFERGTDPNGVIYALKRAAILITQIAGGKVSSGITDTYPDRIEHFRVKVTYANIKRLIGKDLGTDTIKRILESLEIVIEKETEHGLALAVPPYRVDVKREADIVEEILRIYGYNNVEIPTAINASLQYRPKPDPEAVRNMLAGTLSACGFHEIWSNSLTKASYYTNRESLKEEHTVKLFNPLSSDLNGLRQTLLFGGLEAIAYNANRKLSDLRLFEFGNCYFTNGQKNTDNPLGDFHEEERLALFITGKKEGESWNTPQTDSNLFQLKAYVELLLIKTGLPPEKLKTSIIQTDLSSEGLAYSLPNGEKLIELSVVHPGLQKEFGIDKPVYFAEFAMGNIIAAQKNNKIAFTRLPKYPEVHRDLALLINKDITFEQIKDTAFKTERKLLRSVNLFDVYEGKGIPENKKSYAVSFVLRDEEKTLNDKQIDRIMQKFITTFEKELGAQLR